MTDSEKTKTASTTLTAVSPFNRPSEDVILRSSDGVDFYVNKWILIHTSAVFADMFSLPQPASDASSDDPSAPSESVVSSPPTEFPVVELNEVGTTIETLLRLFHPLPPSPDFPTFDSAKPVLEAAHKYQMDHAFDLLRPQLLRFSKVTPVRVYALAARSRVSDLMRSAADEFLRSSNRWVYADELSGISGTEYFGLQMYREQCTAAMRALSETDLKTWFTNRNEWTWFTCRYCVEHYADNRNHINGRCGDCVEAPWFREHWSRMFAILMATPSPDAIRNLSHLNQTLKDASACKVCRLVVFQQLCRFNDILIADIEQRLFMVSLETVPCVPYTGEDSAIE
ncbi:hypothetical protein C8Q74DRAFT_1247696 [Fomes fomentarius]|nr:hypothetical protein C8Q74DRAFT_1247696 [Fomes fomentarius]